MKHAGFWILVCSTGRAEDGHSLMLTTGEVQVFVSLFSQLIYLIKNILCSLYLHIWCMHYLMIFIIYRSLDLLRLKTWSGNKHYLCFSWRLWERVSREAFRAMGCCGCKWLLQLCHISGIAYLDYLTFCIVLCVGCNHHYIMHIIRKDEQICYTSLIVKVETGRVDGERLCVTGESAGGFTTLACLAFRQAFKAGSSLYGASFRFPFFSFFGLQLNTS